MTILWASTFETPIGLVTAIVDGGAAVKRFHFGKFDRPGLRRDARAVEELRRQIEAYFAGERRDFDLPLAPEGTEFQREVWDGLLTIPFGATLSYGELAARIGRPGLARAVGAANGANPIGLIIPCHRVIGADGSLTGFGGGIKVKAALLAHEGVLPPQATFAAGPRTRVGQALLL